VLCLQGHEAMRLIKTYKAKDGNYTKVYRNIEWDEYIVHFYNHQGVHMEAADYHTDDKQDALSTAQLATMPSGDGIPMRNMRDFDKL